MSAGALVGWAAVGAALTAGLLVLLRPLLARYALARPNARSSHRVPTPQGAGIAVIAATVAVAAAGCAIGTVHGSGAPVAVLAGAAILLAVLGGIDDVRPLKAGTRLLVQAIAAAAVVWAAVGGRALPAAIPLAVEQAILAVGLVWFVNLVNFMDGIDWITVAEIVPIAAFVAALGWAGIVPAHVALIAAALAGALLGFAPFNRPVAQIFLGDVGSLPIGLVTGWLLIEVAMRTSVAAALLPPLYYVADTGLTLLRRLAAGERVWEAHRSHFYQRATGNGLSVLAVDGHVLVLNLVLAALSLATIRWPSAPVQAAALGLGCACVAFVLARFARTRA